MTFKFYIDRWLGANDRRSFASLERLTGVPYSTLRRLYEGDGSHGSKSTIPVATVVCTTEEARALINEIHPELRSFLVRPKTFIKQLLKFGTAK